jgi:5'(3')-deoxyribonucleotidase
MICKMYNVTFMDKIRHLLNPLHIYCRLKYIGVSQKVALEICNNYEIFVYRRTVGKPC